MVLQNTSTYKSTWHHKPEDQQQKAFMFVFTFDTAFLIGSLSSQVLNQVDS
jgi:hypothetical protein